MGVLEDVRGSAGGRHGADAHYDGRLETDFIGQSEQGTAWSPQETQLALMQRSLGTLKLAILATQGSISNCLEDLGRTEESLKLSVQILRV